MDVAAIDWPWDTFTDKAGMQDVAAADWVNKIAATDGEGRCTIGWADGATTVMTLVAEMNTGGGGGDSRGGWAAVRSSRRKSWVNRRGGRWRGRDRQMSGGGT